MLHDSVLAYLRKLQQKIQADASQIDNYPTHSSRKRDNNFSLTVGP